MRMAVIAVLVFVLVIVLVMACWRLSAPAAPTVQPVPAKAASPARFQSRDLIPAAGPGTSAGRHIDLPALSGLQSGDELVLRIPQEYRSLRATVTSIESTPAGNRVVTGELVDPDSRGVFPFVITTGRRLTFGTLQTGRNRYQLEVRQGVGTLVAVTELKKDIDASRPDYVVPQRPVPERPE